MSRRIFLAGAAGAIGRRLTPLLARHGFHVTGTTRSRERTELIAAMGATPVVVDVFDAAALADAVVGAQPDVVIHQLTDLSGGLDASHLARSVERNARIRRDGTRNLVDAAAAAGARRLIAQSIAWAYAPGRMPHVETDPLDVDAPAPRAVTVSGVAALEDAVLHHRQIDGVVLRYARLYGPGTGALHAADAELRVHVDAAAYAALLAIDHGAGIYNIAETDTLVSCGKARRDLGWSASMRIEPRTQPLERADMGAVT
jgi:nucleoside-diphosphate-sugar epimerase